MSTLPPAIGIDLGTTYTCIGYFQNGVVHIISNKTCDLKTIPSCVYIGDNDVLVGTPAKRKMGIEPQRTLYDAKRLIGRKFDDPKVQKCLQNNVWPFTVVDVDGEPCFVVKRNGKPANYSPEKISSEVLKSVLQQAEKVLNTSIKKAVITVPAHFTETQLSATLDAARLAGIEVLDLMNEPTAAAYAYAIDFRSEKEKTVLVFDLGGGTFDISIMSIKEGGLTVKKINGDTFLGGRDFDNRMVNYLIEKVEDTSIQEKIRQSDYAMTRLYQVFESEAKRELSDIDETEIVIPGIISGYNYEETLTRSEFENICEDLFGRPMVVLENTLRSIGMTRQDIDEVLLVGGSTLMPKPQKLLKQFFGEEKIRNSENPVEIVAKGATLQAAIKLKHLENIKDFPQIADLNSLSLGVSLLGGRTLVVLPRNTPFGMKLTERTYTSKNNQTSAYFKIIEGERGMVDDNFLIGEIAIDGIPPRPAGEERTDITFVINEKHDLEVTMTNVSTGKTVKKTFPGNLRCSNLPAIYKAIANGRKYKEEDKKKADEHYEKAIKELERLGKR